MPILLLSEGEIYDLLKSDKKDGIKDLHNGYFRAKTRWNTLLGLVLNHFWDLNNEKHLVVP